MENDVALRLEKRMLKEESDFTVKLQGIYFF